MGIFDSIKSYGQFVRMAVAAQDAGDSARAAWNWNELMYQVRKQLEFVDRHLGGRDFIMFGDPLFVNALHGKEGFVIMGSPPPVQDIQEICEAWERESLYEQILNGDPGVLSDVSLDALAWFNGLLNAAVCYVEIDRKTYREYTSMMKRWPGKSDLNASWLDDLEP